MTRFLSSLLTCLMVLIASGCTQEPAFSERSDCHMPAIRYSEEIESGTETWKGELNILVIGNSFGIDITKKLPSICVANRIRTVHITQLYKGFSSIDLHLNALKNKTNIYEELWETENGEWKQKPPECLTSILKLKHWDVIAIADNSVRYADPQTQVLDIQYFLIEISKNLRYNPKYVLLGSWAYADNYNIQNFEVYKYNEKLMYETICKSTLDYIIPLKLFWKIVPCGTSIQNARESSINIHPLHLTRDGFHADLGFSRTLLAYTFFSKVILPYTQIKFENINFIDWNEGNITCYEGSKHVLKESLYYSLIYPFSLTKIN